jgi:hypothetical protein
VFVDYGIGSGGPATLKADNSLHLLSASLPSLGLSLPIYQEVHPELLQNNPEVHERFLEALAAMVPPGCRPIVVSNGGFKTPSFKAVAKLGWDWLGRVRGMVQLTRLAKTRGYAGPRVWHY